MKSIKSCKHKYSTVDKGFFTWIYCTKCGKTKEEIENKKFIDKIKDAVEEWLK